MPFRELRQKQSHVGVFPAHHHHRIHVHPPASHANEAPSESGLTHEHFPSTSTQVTELKERLRPMQGFWVSLPHTICSDEKIAADVTNEDRCWNGQTRGR